ncbi:hypothetical protein [Aquabacterium sp. CECT 9606]|uniref:hypothetical protein n=1 Tax=Aquabacterium sp. CECT 9606 TaxID=2845822 RepID=UPI001E42BE14|nr:hypothetical protein [Aquabacterium sp. CECT 9606]CAH0351208.1 hypothetical protein AQB9606_01978 [Aquabacterium sp. CECT 9606]
MTRLHQLLLATAAATILVACGGGDDPNRPTTTPADVTAQVPPAAVTSPDVATAYVGDLSAVPPATSDALEPVAVPEVLASDDTAEPTMVN